MSLALKRPGFVGLTVLVLLAINASGAVAVNGMSVSPGGIASTISGTLKVIEAEVPVNCPITLTGSFPSSLLTNAQAEAEMGSITGLRSGTCSRGSIVSTLNLPSRIRLLRLNGQTLSEAPAGRSFTMEVATNIGIRVRLNNGRECLVSFLENIIRMSAVAEYDYRLTSGELIGECLFGFAEIRFEGVTPTQTVTLLPGSGEVINGTSPSLVNFGSVRAGELAQRTVTVETARGGRIEEIRIFTGRYFAITDPNGCRGRVLAEHATCTFNVILSAPTEAGRVVSDSATVRFEGSEIAYGSNLRAST